MSTMTLPKLSYITLHAPCAQRARVSRIFRFSYNLNFIVSLTTLRAPRALGARGARSGTVPVEPNKTQVRTHGIERQTKDSGRSLSKCGPMGIQVGQAS